MRNLFRFTVCFYTDNDMASGPNPKKQNKTKRKIIDFKKFDSLNRPTINNDISIENRISFSPEFRLNEMPKKK